MGDNPQRWKLKAWVFAYCLYSPSEKLSVLDGVMFCVLFHQMKDADSKLGFPADKQDRYCRSSCSEGFCLGTVEAFLKWRTHTKNVEPEESV